MALKDFLGKNPMNSDRKDQPNKSDPEGNVPKPDGKGILNRISSIVLPALIIFLVVVAVSGSFYTLSETESAIVTTFGRATVNNNKGLQFKIPFIQHVTKINTTVRSFEIGYVDYGDGSYRNVEEESIMITSDMNFVDIDFFVTYQVTDPLQYMYATEKPELILKNLIQSTIRGTVEKQQIGLSLIDISIQDVEPPTDRIKEAFSEVENARQNKESALNEANQYRNEQIPAAEAKADKIIQEAEAKKTARINEANGQVARFNSEYAEYTKYPLITRQRMFYEAMENILPNVKIIINNDEDGTTQRMYLGDLDGSFGEAEAAAQAGRSEQTGGDQ